MKNSSSFGFRWSPVARLGGALALFALASLITVAEVHALHAHTRPLALALGETTNAADSLDAAPDSLFASPDSLDESVPPDSTLSPGTTPADADTSIAPPSPSGPPMSERKGSVKRALRNFGSDAMYVLKSPSRLDGKGLVLLAGVVGASAALYANDRAIYDDFIRSRGDFLYDAAEGGGDLLGPLGLMGITVPVYTVGALAGDAFDLEPLQRVSLELIETHLISSAIRNTFKYAIGRERPKDGHGPYHYRWGGRSFPSGHASTVFELATILSENARRWPVTLAAYGVATMIAVERIDAGVHWPSDVFVGSAAGVTVAHMIVRRHEQRRSGMELKARAIEGVPTLGVTWRFGARGAAD